jgi:hypothetical protein
MRRFLVAATVVSAFSFLLNRDGARASTLVLASQEFTVDSDSDSVLDLFDNAPGIANNQADTDNDGIGDVIDPTLSTSNPYLGDPGLGVYSSPSILAGGTATFDFLMTIAEPPGSFGRIELDFNLDNTTDAVYFGPLTSSINTIAIPASLFADASWDLNTPGVYTVGMKAFAPGMWSQSWVYPTVSVSPVPEPSTIFLFALAALSFMCGRPLWKSVKRYR